MEAVRILIDISLQIVIHSVRFIDVYKSTCQNMRFWQAKKLANFHLHTLLFLVARLKRTFQMFLVTTVWPLHSSRSTKVWYTLFLFSSLVVLRLNCPLPFPPLVDVNASVALLVRSKPHFMEDASSVDAATQLVTTQEALRTLLAMFSIVPI